MSGDFSLIMGFIANVMISIFTALDSVYIGGYSLLDIFCALILLDIILWFLFKVFGLETPDLRPGDYEDSESHQGYLKHKSDRMTARYKRGK